MKKVSVHRSARMEVSAILRYLDVRAGEQTGDAFFAEVMAALERLRLRHSDHFFRGDIRRINLKRFPYHLLYRVHQSVVRVLTVRHHHRHPDHGADRW